MPDKDGKTSGPGIDAPDQAYKQGRAKDIEEGSLGVNPGGEADRESRLPEGADEAGSYQSGGFANSPDGADEGAPVAGSSGAASAGQKSPTDVGEGGKDPAPGRLGDADPDEVGQRGAGQQPDYDANDPEARQQHPKTPS
jgi:hypothetical protein